MNFFRKMPDIKIIKKLNDNESYYSSAVVVKVTDGKGALTLTCGHCIEGVSDMPASLVLNGKPLLQVHTENYYCPTCAALLSAGYGIENCGCTEFSEVSERLNEDFISIEKSVEIITPVLGLLPSGTYMIADVPHYPTDGTGRFFWNVPNEKKYNNAACQCYCNWDIYFSAYPAYLYPTQGTEKYDPERVGYYVARFKEEKSRPRALAFSAEGFISALLDGHHKACAAAILGENVPCITIIPLYNGYKEKPFERSKKETEEYESDIMSGIPDERYVQAAMLYPTIEDLAVLYHYKIKNITKEQIDTFLSDPPELSAQPLTAIMNTEAAKKNPLVRYAAMEILNKALADIRNGYIVNYELSDSAVRALKYFHDSDVEQLMIDLLVEDEYKSSDLVKNYWD